MWLGLGLQPRWFRTFARLLVVEDSHLSAKCWRLDVTCLLGSEFLSYHFGSRLLLSVLMSGEPTQAPGWARVELTQQLLLLLLHLFQHQVESLQFVAQLEVNFALRSRFGGPAEVVLSVEQRHRGTLRI